MNKNFINKQVYHQKPSLKLLYESWYKRIQKDMSPIDGVNIELGSGFGSIRSVIKNIITTDIAMGEGIDKVIDAHKLDFNDNSVSNLILIDTLHHLVDPRVFFNEAHRVLKRKGRILIIEPYPSIFSLPVYKMFHKEPFIFSQDYFTQNKQLVKKDPWDSNQACAYLLFFKHADKFHNEYKNKFKFVKKEKFGSILYPLSGGFTKFNLLPVKLFNLLGKIENNLKFLNNALAFRVYVILEKN